MPARQAPYRERARRAVKREIAETAERLFAERGYDATTIDDVAAAVGMSSRTLFRYFPTKEDLVVGKLDRGIDQLLTALRARPEDEPVWASLKAVFEAEVTGVDGLCSTVEGAQDTHRVILATPSLQAAYLQKLQLLVDAIERLIHDRAAAAGTPYPPDDPVPRAIAGAALACLLAAHRAWLADAHEDFPTLLDRAMTAIAPVGIH
jgi:AcrR family transcriptional regulator